MTYCTKCGKPTDNGIMCKDCMILDSPWLSAMNRKENDLIEQIEQLKAENAALKEKLEKAVELPCKIGDRFYIVEYYPPEIIEEECCDFSFIESSKILLDNGCGVTYELGDNGCFFVTLDKNEAIRIYNQKEEEQND